ncbi:carbohydrate esterase family 4 protein [Hysterangium stoloniferum]|nr:carbohydrate esterase family 4 protein [Hysterangium stoloniferum]
MKGPSTKFLLFISLGVAAAPHHDCAHIETVPRSLSGSWYHPESHPVRALFKRDVPTPGSSAWQAQYPQVWAPPIPETTTPPSWLAALNAAEAAGQIPEITIPTVASGQNPRYGPNDDPTGPKICSSTFGCRQPDDEWDAPDGHVAIGFDDGPTLGSALLYSFLKAQNLSATHFMIGMNILTNYALFNNAFSTLQIHTWTHPYMTTQSNTQIVAQLGWTMQIIHDSTGGRIPRYWRPPYGDSDNRVRAIAKSVFGLTQINWNQDSADWNLATGARTQAQVEGALTGWYSGPKSPGLIILEHELTDKTSQAFIDTFPVLKSHNWIPVSAVQLFDGAYQNSPGATGSVMSMDVGVAAPSATQSLAVHNNNITGTGVSSGTLAPSSPTTSSSPSNKGSNASVGSLLSPMLALASILCMLLAGA